MGPACRILVPQPRIQPPIPGSESENPNHWTTREFPVGTFSDALYHLTPGGITLSGAGTSPPLTPQTIAIHSSLVREGNGTPPILLPGKSHGQKSLVGYSPPGR